MSGYTYDARQDYAGFDNLTGEAREWGDRINRQARETGADRQDLLRACDAPAEVKVALAEVWGGPGAGKEFQP